MNLISGHLNYFYQQKKHCLAFKENGVLKDNFVKILLKPDTTAHGKIYEISIQTENEIEIDSVHLEVPAKIQKNDKIFLNGYQSWTDSREYRPDEKIFRMSRLLKPLHRHFNLKYMGDEYFYHYSGRKGEFHGYTYSYIRKPDNSYLFIGSLTEKYGFTIFQYHTHRNMLWIQKECHGIKVHGVYPLYQLYAAEGEENAVFQEYFDAMHLPKLKSKPIAGWTSWYYHYTRITEKIILDNLRNFEEKKLPVQVFQIDDGYQNAVGDWLLINRKFPGGMKMISDKIHQAKYQAGLWLAPFIAEQKSRLFKEHPEWVLKDNKGNKVSAGFNDQWGGYFYALDIYNPEFREYLRNVFNTVLNDWNYDLVKLDFLYAACMLPRGNKTRGQIMSEAMEFLRELVGNKLILGCGVPLGPAFGLVDYCRIGCDVGLEWEFHNTSVIHFRERISTINAIVDTISRRQLNGKVFYNDPDVFILRDDNVKLNKNQKETLFIMNLLMGGVLFTSDDISRYSSEAARKYQAVFKMRDCKVLSVTTHDREYHCTQRSSISQLIKGIQPYRNVIEMKLLLDGKNYILLSNLGNNNISLSTDGKTFNISPYKTECYDDSGNPVSFWEILKI